MAKLNFSDSIDSVRKADLEYNRVMDSIVQAYEKTRGNIEIDKTEKAVYEDLPTIMAVGTLVVIFGSFFVYNFLNSRYWERGVFPPFMLNRKINRYEAVVNLAVNLIRFDRDANRSKTGLLQQYLHKMFPGIQGDMSDSYSSALAQPVSTASICAWLKPKMTISERDSLFTLLFDIAVTDAKIGQKEYAELLTFCRKMDIPESRLAQETESFKRKFAESVYEEQQKQAKSAQYSQKDYLKNRYLSVLGLQEDYTAETLKKAYRKLVKSCHPDMVRSSSPTEKEQLNQRFLEIQEAYEYLVQWV